MNITNFGVWFFDVGKETKKRGNKVDVTCGTFCGLSVTAIFDLTFIQFWEVLVDFRRFFQGETTKM